MEGKGTLTAIDGVAGNISMPGKITIRDFQSPAQLNFGLSYKPDEQWLITADISRIFLEHAMKDINVGFVANNGQNINILLPQNYRDQTALSLGAAFTSGKWTLRGGARFTTQALRSDTVLAVIPAIPTVFSTVGFSYQLSEESNIDFAWVHSFEETMTNSSQPNTSKPIDVVHAQDSLNIALTWDF
jgi:long-chain fatty acid transport protein